MELLQLPNMIKHAWVMGAGDFITWSFMSMLM